MGWNRLVDRRVDAKNPRTENRLLPRGLLSRKEVLFFVFFSLAVFFFAAAMLNPLTLMLSPVALFLLIFYSYSKHFTALSHLLLGLTLAAAPVGGFIAVEGRLALEAMLLGAAVLFWVAGFDIIYSLQDYDFDQREGLFSLPVRIGIDESLTLTRVFHFLTLVFLIILGLILNSGLYYLLGLLVVAGLLFIENYIISSRDLSRINLVFFKINGMVSLVLLLFTLLDYLLT